MRQYFLKSIIFRHLAEIQSDIWRKFNPTFGEFLIRHLAEIQPDIWQNLTHRFLQREEVEAYRR